MNARLPRNLLPPFALALLFNLTANLLRLHEHTYDAFTHIFFASHYMNDWFNLWESRWYGGFSVTSYPPLIHQLIALLRLVGVDQIFGSDSSYQFICIISSIFFVFSMYKVARVFLDISESKYVSWVAAAIPSFYLTVYVYGQLPTAFAASLSFLTARVFYDYLLNGRIKDLVYTSLLSVLVSSSHHFTFIFFLPLLLALSFIMSIVKYDKSWRDLLRRLLVAFFVSALLVIIVIEPFFEFVLKTPFQVEIPHASRGNIFMEFSHSLLFFWGIYGILVPLIPIGFMIVRKRTELIPLILCFTFLFVLGLGGTTPVPEILFGDLWHVLTFDRFALWASFLFSFLVGIMIKDAGKIMGKYYRSGVNSNLLNTDGKTVRSFLIIGLFASSIFTLSLSLYITPSPTPEPVLEEVAVFLEENKDYRYVTFGLGPSFIKLTSICSAETVDGGYNSARRLQIFIDSGIERVDNAKFFPNGTVFLDALLNSNQSATFSLKWAVVADIYYIPFLERNGYEKVNITLNSDPNIEIWCRDQVYMTEIRTREAFNDYQVAAWSLGPIIALFSFSILYTWGILGDNGVVEDR